MTRTALVRVAASVLLAAPWIALVPAPAAAADTTACSVSQADVVWDAGTSELSTSGSSSIEGTELHLADGAGVLDPVGPVGSISFDATIEFTSDAGVETTLTNPTLVLSETSGQLLFDVQPDGTAQVAQSPLAEIDLRAGAVSEEGETVTATAVDAPTERSADAVAFWDGAPGLLGLTLTADCPPVAASAGPTGAAGPGEPVDDGGAAGSVWITLAVIGAAVVLAGLLTVGSVARRRRDAASVDAAPAAQGPAGDAAGPPHPDRTAR